MNKVLIVVLASLLLVSCNTVSKEIKSISTDELKKILNKEKIQLLDVRTTIEIENGFIETALFSDVLNENFHKNAVLVLNKKKPVYIYCKSGGRSMVASKILQKKGYTVFNVLGGYTKWKKEN